MRKLIYLLVALLASSCAVLVPTEPVKKPAPRPKKVVVVSQKKTVRIEKKAAKHQARESKRLSQQKR